MVGNNETVLAVVELLDFFEQAVSQLVEDRWGECGRLYRYRVVHDKWEIAVDLLTELQRQVEEPEAGGGRHIVA